ncbi:MAG TPA: hypothetical protein DGH68_03990 [Bacteroidetes bacterium]|jgi:hypothetical protein|nr:hypothetical protein [Bacteroidota bacterium]
MKKTLVVICAWLALSSVASAQLSFDGGAHVGMAISSFPKPLKDYYGTGLLFGGHGELNIMKYVSVRLNLDYVSFSSDKDKIKGVLATQYGVQASDIVFDGLATKDFSVFIDGLGKIPIQGSPITPYGLVGLGLNFLSASDGTITYQGTAQPQLTIKGDSSTKFGLDFGAGSEFRVASKVKLFLEFKYVLIFTENESTSYMPIVVGGSFGI